MKNLILIHGAIGAADQMQPLADLLKSQFNVHILELDGHGKSAGKDKPFTLDHFTDQLSALLDEIGEDAHVFGYSMGGFIALLQVAKPDSRIRSIFTLGTKLEWNDEIAAKECTMLNAAKIEEKVPAFAQALAKRHGSNEWKNVLSNTANLLEEIGRSQPIQPELIGKIKCPVNLCLGDQDNMVSVEETRAVEQWLINGSFSILPNSLHPIEKVDVNALAEKIREFMME
jgi:pimeloyl-ACP methyl ester carboxylesterase